MTTLIIARGIDHSDNYLWAEQWVAEDAENRVRVNRDLIRNELFGENYSELTKEMKADVSSLHEFRIEHALSQGKDVVVDMLGLSNDGLRHYRNVALTHGAEYLIKNFHVGIRDALLRNEANGETLGRVIPERAVMETYSKFEDFEVADDLAEYFID